MGEFELIRRYFAQASHDASVILGIGDDCAVLQMPENTQLVISIDSLIEGTHFLPGTAPDRLAERLLGSAVSDLAAMGAQPLWLTLALTLPEANEAWLEPFACRLAQRAGELGIQLVGGDTTRGPLALSAQVHGYVEPGRALTRQGAQSGDLVCVTGTLGDSRGGLECLLKKHASSERVDYLQQRFFCPEPRLSAGAGLVGYASACLDVSDGLMGDLSHLLTPGLGAELELTQLPLSDALVAEFGRSQARQWALTGGEDFELCFTLPPRYRAVLDSLDGKASIVGQIVEGEGVTVRSDGDVVKPASAAGFDHFSRD